MTFDAPEGAENRSGGDIPEPAPDPAPPAPAAPPADEVIGTRHGMFGAEGTGDTSGYGGLVRTVEMRPPMPWFDLREMSEPVLRALYAFVRSLGPAGVPARVVRAFKPDDCPMIHRLT